MIDSVIGFLRRPILKEAVSTLLLALLVAVPARGQDSPPDAVPDLNAAQLLADAMLFNCDVSVSMTEETAEPWKTSVHKITIPGRSVTVGLEGDGSRLDVHFTLYPTEGDSLFLVAKSETWTDDGYSSAISSMTMAYREEVYYYPLGRAGDDVSGSQVEIRMTIGVVPYLETLDDAARASLESAFDSSALFDLTGEGG